MTATVNFAQRFQAQCVGEPWAAYCALRAACPTPFAGYLSLPGADAILSLSPERFVRVSARQVETRPIKGTRPRSADPAQDAAFAAELLASDKDRAENLMIVDLLRNDLGRSCRIGSVKVPELFSLESYPNVHHLVSSVTGELAAGNDALDLIGGSFPGGSITGALKIRAMQIIDELEPTRRSLYCGSLMYWTCAAKWTAQSPSAACWSRTDRFPAGAVAASSPTRTARRNIRKPSPKSVYCWRRLKHSEPLCVAKRTQSVQNGIPTQSVGTIARSFRDALRQLSPVARNGGFALKASNPDSRP